MREEKLYRLKRHYSVVAHSGDIVELRHGAWNAISYTLSDEGGSGALLRVLNRLDGALSPAEIASAENVPQSDVELVLDQLSQLGMLEEGPEHALDYYLDHVIPNLAPYAGRRQSPSLSILVVGGSDDIVAREIGRVLGSSEVSGAVDVEYADSKLQRLLALGATTWNQDAVAFEEEVQAFVGWRDRLVVVAQSVLNPLTLRAFNRVSLHHRIPWIQAAIDGPFLLLGPTFLPWRSACYECLEARVGMNLRERASYQSYKRALVEGRATRSTAVIDAVLASMLGSYAAFEALNLALTGASFTIGKLLAIYLPTMEFTFNEVLRLPGCHACGPSPEADDRELYFELRTLLGPSSNGADAY